MRSSGLKHRRDRPQIAKITCISCGSPLFAGDRSFSNTSWSSVQNDARAEGESVVSDTCAHDNENWPVIWIKNS